MSSWKSEGALILIASDPLRQILKGSMLSLKLLVQIVVSFVWTLKMDMQKSFSKKPLAKALANTHILPQGTCKSSRASDPKRQH